MSCETQQGMSVGAAVEVADLIVTVAEILVRKESVVVVVKAT